MICSNCGKENGENAKFCAGCGAKMEPVAAQAAPTPVSEPVPAPAPVYEPAPAPVAVAPAKPKADIAGLIRKNKWILIGIAAILVIALVAVVVISNIEKEVSISNYLKLEESGYDGLGEVAPSFDTVSLAMYLLGEKDMLSYGDYDIDLTDDDEYEDWEDDIQDEYGKDKVKAILKFCDSIEVSLEYPDGKDNESLAIGDVITVEISWSKSRAEELKLDITGGKFEYTMANLDPIETINLFDYCTLEPIGVDTLGYARVYAKASTEVKVGELTFIFSEGSSEFYVYSDDSAYYDYYGYFEIFTDNYDLSNGDVLQIGYYSGMDAEDLRYHGAALASETVELTVEGLTPITKVDLMDNLTLTYEGLNGDGDGTLSYIEKVVEQGGFTFNFEDWTISKDGEIIGDFWCSTDYLYYLENGEVLNVEMRLDYSMMDDYGLTLENDTKQFTVAGLAEYLKDLSGVNENIDAVTEAAKAELLGMLNDSWSYMVHHSYWNQGENPEIVAEPALFKIILTLDEHSYTENTVWFIFKTTLNDSILAQPTDLYFAITNDNLALYPSGQILQTNKYMYYSQSYPDYESLYTALIDGNSYTVFELVAP